MSKTKIIILSFLVLVIVIEYQISTLEVNAKENGRFSSVGRMNLRSDWLTKEITTVIHQQNEIKDFFPKRSFSRSILIRRKMPWMGTPITC